MLKRKAADDDPRGSGPGRPDTLEYWYMQENTPLADDPAPTALRQPEAPARREFVSGWWILPILAVSVFAWAALFALAF